MRRWGVVAAGLLVLLAGCTGSREGTPSAEALPGLPAGARVDYQLAGGYPPADDVAGVVRDRTDSPAPGRWSGCYVNAFQTQPGETAWPEDLLLHRDGSRVADPDWPGEFLVDLSTPVQRDRALAVVGPWFDGCAGAGFAAVEPDNLDSWTRSGGLLDAGDAAAFARLLVDRAHARGLLIGQKNAPELAGAQLGFDYAVTEDCGRYDECGVYTDVYGSAVLDVEYSDAGFARACRAGGFSVQRRDLAVSTPGTPGYVAEWCPDS
ncbi:endo alpha-1,4 polygalactosaminidase [Modestobacter sp. NPDC049651]|uniref:endo alpha-1,4 polygalactosaminidase n=1 Tax=unclassified Modestobacter TaxID=2643866 RepID=UPI003401CF7B